MMPLIYAQKNEPQIIRKIGGSPEVKKHLKDLGFNVGGQVSIVSSLGQNLIIKVKDKKKGKSSCGCSCEHCKMCCACKKN